MFRAEDMQSDELPPMRPRASMGPLLFRAEDLLFRLQSLALHRLASMGPLLFRAEDVASLELILVRSPLLQWGRSCSERKTG